MSEYDATITSSVVRPPWICPKCGQANANTASRCTNKRYDETSPRYHAIPPVPVGYSLQTFGEYLESLGLAHVDPPAVAWECSPRLEPSMSDEPAVCERCRDPLSDPWEIEHKICLPCADAQAFVDNLRAQGVTR